MKLFSLSTVGVALLQVDDKGKPVMIEMEWGNRKCTVQSRETEHVEPYTIIDIADEAEAARLIELGAAVAYDPKRHTEGVSPFPHSDDSASRAVEA